MLMLMLMLVSCLSVLGQGTVKKYITTPVGTFASWNEYAASRRDSTVSLQIGENWYVTGKCSSYVNIDLHDFVRGAKFYGLVGSGHDTLVVFTLGYKGNLQWADTSLTVLFAPGAVESLRPEWFGANPYDLLDDTKAIQIAVNSLPTNGGTVQFQDGQYLTSSKITVSKNGVYFKGTKPANDINGKSFTDYSQCQIRYIGAANLRSIMIHAYRVQNFSMENMYLNGNDSAGYCLYMEGVNLPAGLTRGGTFNNLAFRSYRKCAWAIGDTISTSQDAQFHIISAKNIRLFGGATAMNADGIHVNAQNLEMLVIDGLYIDPWGFYAAHHRNHIRQIAGGICITGMSSTRGCGYSVDSALCPAGACLSDYAVYSRDQIIINGWRSEDRKLFYQYPAAIQAPSMLMNVVQREYARNSDSTISFPDTVRGYVSIELNATQSEITITNSRICGSIALGATDVRANIQNVKFSDKNHVGDRRVIFYGPRNQRGIVHEVDSGNIRIAGTYPIFDIVDTAGNSKFAVKNGSVVYQSRTNALITANQNDYEIGDGTNRKIESNGDYNITGMTGGENGRWIFITMTNAHTITFKHENASSVSANRFSMADGKDLLLGENEMAGFFHNGGNWKGFKFRNKTFDSLYAANISASGGIKFTTAITNKSGATDGLIDVVCDTGVANGVTTRASKGGAAYGGTGRIYFRDDGSTTETNLYLTRGGSDNTGLYIKGNGNVVVTTTTSSTSSTTGALSVAGGVGVAMGITVGQKIVIPSTNYFYLGDSATAGTWRIGRDTDSLKFQRLESGVWVTKQRMTP